MNRSGLKKIKYSAILKQLYQINSIFSKVILIPNLIQVILESQCKFKTQIQLIIQVYKLKNLLQNEQVRWLYQKLKRRTFHSGLSKFKDPINSKAEMTRSLKTVEEWV